MQENRLQTMCGIRCFGKSIFMLQGVCVHVYLCACVCSCAYEPVSTLLYFNNLAVLLLN